MAPGVMRSTAITIMSPSKIRMTLDATRLKPLMQPMAMSPLTTPPHFSPQPSAQREGMSLPAAA